MATAEKNRKTIARIPLAILYRSFMSRFPQLQFQKEAIMICMGPYV
jgi:hypothetical protein